ncbi:juvenile hormone esterase-like [Anticarsia gemmatalis]|uniref:juvenile hormone esterase-like n=1 Tax=Anticarsia gemmatalis TaxID=129554 RepID=UPI003F7603AD
MCIMSGRSCLAPALAALLAILAAQAQARSEPNKVCVKIETGSVCGQMRRADDNSDYASFRGVPYAKQPLGELRFKELEPAVNWTGNYDATNEGPICFQTDVFYGKIMQAREMNESCIFANVHVPKEALTASGRKLPILVFIHGGGFAFGSGDTDLHGPEYLVSKKVVVITFNYRLNVFGFLSLNSSEVPGNMGLRDMVTLLRWVQRNAAAFGGDPNNVTLAGQSAGAIAAHVLSMSKAAEGLFQRVIMMSGTAISSLYSPSPYFAQFLVKQLLAKLAIEATDPHEIYKRLIELPAEKLWEANRDLIDKIGFLTFVPTVESSFPGVTPMLEDYPDILLAKGRGKDVPLLVGYTDSECETFRPRLEEFDLVQKNKESPFIIVPPKVLFTTPPALLPDIGKKIETKYYNNTVTVDGFIKCCTDGFYEYPVMKLVEARGGNSSTFVYKFEYESDNSVLKEVAELEYHGAGHVEDLTYVFKVNSVLDESSYLRENDDAEMTDYMTNIFVNFMQCSKPICGKSESMWPSASRDQFLYQEIQSPNVYNIAGVTAHQQDVARFFDTLTRV